MKIVKRWLLYAVACTVIASGPSFASDEQPSDTAVAPCAFTCSYLGRINHIRDGFQTQPDLVRLGDGRLMASWHHSYQGEIRVRAILYDPEERRWGRTFDLNASTGDIRGAATLTALADGAVLAHWWTLFQERNEELERVGPAIWTLHVREVAMDGQEAVASEERVLWRGEDPNAARASLVELQRPGPLKGHNLLLLANGANHELSVITREGDLVASYQLGTRRAEPRGLLAIPAADGGAYVFWIEAGNRVRMARMDSAGELDLRAQPLNGLLSGQAAGLAVTQLTSGDLAIAWHEDFNRIRYAVLSPEGEVVVSPRTASQHEEHNRFKPAIIAMPDGGFTISWTDEIRRESWSLTNPYIHMRRFTSEGRPLRAEQYLWFASGNRDSALALANDGDLFVAHYSGTGWTRNVYLVRCQEQ